ncbi:MAG: rhodanese-like domain-containing protein [Calditerrivibrio sp.]|uniref:rhodanese-like domain-containing protein n=1 Tax=Calditerrivibrio sp. TaxID=2792612 RepID=UPI003D0E2620
MKRLLLAIFVSSLFFAGCAAEKAQQASQVVKPEVKQYVVDQIKQGKEEGEIDKQFFVNEIQAKKPSNVQIIDVRTPFEFAAGHFEGAQHIYINDIYKEKGCESVLSRIPKDKFVVFVCATGARAGEMWSGLKEDCKADVSKMYYLNANVVYQGIGKAQVK